MRDFDICKSYCTKWILQGSVCLHLSNYTLWIFNIYFGYSLQIFHPKCFPCGTGHSQSWNLSANIRKLYGHFINLHKYTPRIYWHAIYISHFEKSRLNPRVFVLERYYLGEGNPDDGGFHYVNDFFFQKQISNILLSLWLWNRRIYHAS